MLLGVIIDPAMARLLVVDDEDDGLLVLQTWLSCYGAIDSARDGAEALELLSQCEYDVVVTDLRMPVISGMEVVRAAQMMDVPAILITGFGDLETLKELITCRPFAYRDKPFTKREIQSAVERALFARRAQQNAIKLAERRARDVAAKRLMECAAEAASTLHGW